MVAAEERGEVPEGSYHRVDVFKTLSPRAVPLPDVFFDGPGDRLFDYEPDDEGIRRFGDRRSRTTADGW
jgi:hypothetical protein